MGSKRTSKSGVSGTGRKKRGQPAAAKRKRVAGKARPKAARKAPRQAALRHKRATPPDVTLAVEPEDIVSEEWDEN